MCALGVRQFISYTYCRMQRERALQKLSQFIEEESITEEQFVGVKHSYFASKPRFIIHNSLKDH